MKYNENNRGIIQDSANFHQRILFSGIKYGKCMPTDIDAALEFGGKALILYEIKCGDSPVPRGQMLLLQRIIDAWQQDGKQAVLFICRHRVPSDRDIELRKTLVTEIYYNGKLRTIAEPKTADIYTNDFLRFAEVVT